MGLSIWFFFLQKKKGATYQGLFPSPEHFLKIPAWIQYIKTPSEKPLCTAAIIRVFC